MTLAEVQERIRQIVQLIDVETEVPVLYRHLSCLHPGDVYLEIGTWQGCSAIIAALSTLPSVNVWTVDSGEFHQAHWGHTPDEYLVILRGNFVQHGVGGRINVSLAGSLGLEWDNPIHLLFVDGDHSPQGVEADVEKWIPFVVSGGVVILHDVTRYEGIRWAANELRVAGWKLIDSGGSIEVYRKPGEGKCQSG